MMHRRLSHQTISLQLKPWWILVKI